MQELFQAYGLGASSNISAVLKRLKESSEVLPSAEKNEKPFVNLKKEHQSDKAKREKLPKVLQDKLNKAEHRVKELEYNHNIVLRLASKLKETAEALKKL